MVELMSVDLPANFLKEEIRDGFLVDEKRKQIWAVELDLFSKFVNVCNKYNLKYFADAGTLLGAVRHKGFIPWDDDMDFVMFRKDYDELCDVGEKEFPYPYCFQREDAGFGSIRGHIQIRNSCTTGILLTDIEKKSKVNQGIFIDIFPIDNLPNAFDRKDYWRELYELRDRAKKYMEENLAADAAKFDQYCFEFEACVKRYAGLKSSKVALLSYEINKKVGNRLIKDYEDSIEMPFEFTKINVPIGYRNILRIIYGSWSKPKLVSSDHEGVFFDVDKPYYVYL